jgi:ligand-binding SRPBCC domain-containing protein
MVKIRLETWINAPVERCFALAVNADFCKLVIGGKKDATSAIGPLTVGDALQWRGRRFGLNLAYVGRIDAMRPCSYLREVQESGFFRHFEHERHFATQDDGTRLRHEVHFEAPLFRTKLARNFVIQELRRRDQMLKEYAESSGWREFLEPRRVDSLIAHRA